MNDHLFSELFPWPADRPLRRARFGRPPAKAAPLTGAGSDSHADAVTDPWCVEWADRELGLHVRVRERPESGEVWAYVSARPLASGPPGTTTGSSTGPRPCPARW